MVSGTQPPALAKRGEGDSDASLDVLEHIPKRSERSYATHEEEELDNALMEAITAADAAEEDWLEHMLTLHLGSFYLSNKE